TLVLLAMKMPAELGPVADPSSDYLARPPWYFMPLFQLLKWFPGGWAIIPIAVLPAVIFGALFLLPFLDRKAERNPFKRPIASLVLLLTIGGATGLIFLAKHQDRNNPEFAEKMKKQEEEAQAFFKTPFEPQIIGATTAMAGAGGAASTAAAPAAYTDNCADCHGANGQGDPDLGPKLVGIGAKPQRTAEDLIKILGDARAYGLKKPMPESFPDLSEADKKAIVEWMLKLK
ncbi:MAG: c-type cytochrome, partial [Blastocatellia bacterium]